MARLDVTSIVQQIVNGAWAELGPKIEALKADWDAHRRQLQARNTELVEENRRLRAKLAEASNPGPSTCKVIVVDENGFPVGRCKIAGPHAIHRTP